MKLFKTKKKKKCEADPKESMDVKIISIKDLNHTKADQFHTLVHQFSIPLTNASKIMTEALKWSQCHPNVSSSISIILSSKSKPKTQDDF